ncbi:lysine-specific demethylase JMJ15 [Selaginella moellendorffii]|uniref:lysine-specific demethylase JMJ15 n=1 Tax=Selaginella moellendorffii TaxID=88036 RepID=UPI000D1CDA16|nr:lysine-specific demethylase JMJ15 [Selaginella moellendorffii]|eukprot:XP_024525589.1 lysine-specific demethylase JMJ15 [Selaginella moellendorffii]
MLLVSCAFNTDFFPADAGIVCLAVLTTHLKRQAMRSAFPDLFHAQPDMPFQLVTMLNPAVLRAKGVPVCTTLQESGNFVITFPRSYHGGFNHEAFTVASKSFEPRHFASDF